MDISSLYNSIFTQMNQTNNTDLQNIYNSTVNTLNSTNGVDSINSSENNPEEDKISFGDIITNEIEQLNNQLVQTDTLTQGVISGEEENLHDVMIATEEARLSLELAVQIRNKCVEAFKEINNMQL